GGRWPVVLKKAPGGHRADAWRQRAATAVLHSADAKRARALQRAGADSDERPRPDCTGLPRARHGGGGLSARAGAAARPPDRVAVGGPYVLRASRARSSQRTLPELVFGSAPSLHAHCVIR